ncbi:tyrosine-protein phosphatase [Streptomyces sp. NPDC046909]|uniref:tyrosine-protein phosphatase n=1 Tax=Streptomyces sp. NPDC046909 TaxID=3155617 RepID=UPI0033DF3063
MSGRTATRTPVNFRPLLPDAAPAARPLFRSAALLAPAPQDLPAALRTGPAGTYLDLRTDQEVRRDGAPTGLLALGWQWVRHPVDDTGGPYGTAEMLERTRTAAALAWAGNGTGPVVVACSLGKDRTGRVAAVIQHWSGLAPAALIADYLHSNDELAHAGGELPERWRAPGAVTAVHAADLEPLLGLLRDDPRWTTPPATTGQAAPAATTGRGAPPVTTGRTTPPVTTGRGAPPVTTGRTTPPVTTGRCAPDAMTGHGVPDETTGRGVPEEATGRCAPDDDGRVKRDLR